MKNGSVAADIEGQIDHLIANPGKSDLSKIVFMESAGMGGTGCSLGDFGTELRLNSEKSSVELSLRRYIIQASNGRMSRKSCSFGVPFRLPTSSRLVLTALEMTGLIQLSSFSEFQELDF